MRWTPMLAVGLAMVASPLPTPAQELIFPPPPGGEIVYPQPPMVQPAPPPLTVGQATAALRHLEPGKYAIHFIHPYTCCPVCVKFCLPCGCYDLKCKECFGTRLKFKYPGLGNDVVIRFKKNGDVAVN